MLSSSISLLIFCIKNVFTKDIIITQVLLNSPTAQRSAQSSIAVGLICSAIFDIVLSLSNRPISDKIMGQSSKCFIFSSTELTHSFFTFILMTAQARKLDKSEGS